MKYKNDNNGSNPDVSIMILNWNTDKLLEQCLTSIIQNTEGIYYEIVIVDNNSAGRGFGRVKQKFSKYSNFSWIENDKNIGGLAANQALQYCRGRYLLILGPDTIILPQSLKRMVDFLDNNKEAGAVTAKLLNPDGTSQNYYYKFWNLAMFFFSTIVGELLDRIFFKGRFRRYYFGGDIDPSKTTIIDQPAAACFMFRWDLATNYIIDEDFSFYFGDVDLCKRIYDSGYKIFLLSSAEVIHFRGSSFKKADNLWKRREYKSSAIKYFKKYHNGKVIFLKLIFLLDDFIKIFYKKLSISTIELIKRELFDCNTVLDLSFGYNSLIQYCNISFLIRVELFKPYLYKSKKKDIYNKYMKRNIRKIEFESKSFDAAVALDLLENLTKEEGYKLIKKMEKWARKKIIIFTPNEYIWQNGYDNNSLQEHKSGWTVEELQKLGFKVYGINDWKKFMGYKGTIKYKPRLLWYLISKLTQKIAYRHPNLAFQLFAIKKVDHII